MFKQKDIKDLLRSFNEQVWEHLPIKEFVEKLPAEAKPRVLHKNDPDKTYAHIDWDPENSPLKFSVSAERKEDIDALCRVIHELNRLKPSRLQMIADSTHNLGAQSSKPYFEILFDALETGKFILKNE